VVACRLHSLEHGRLPERLGDLVPAYLGELPGDPVTGSAFGYDPEAAMLLVADQENRQPLAPVK
jgi:hypothetical protein